MGTTFSIIWVGLLIIGWLMLFGLLVWAWQRSRMHKFSKVEEGTSKIPVLNERGQPVEQNKEGVLLAIEVPKDSEITALAAELMFASLHGIYRPENERSRTGQEYISFELQAKEKSIRFFVWTPRHLQGYVEGQIYAQYPGVTIHEFKDYASKTEEGIAAVGADLQLTKEDLFPIKSFESFEVDPLSAITATLSKLEGNAQIWVQVLIRPENDNWRDRAVNYITAVRAGRKGFGATLAKSLAGLASDVVKTAVSGVPATPATPGVEKRVELAPGVEEALKRVEEKSTKLGFRAMIRIVAIGSDPAVARQKLDLVVGSFKQFNTINLNGFTAIPEPVTERNLLAQYAARAFSLPGFVLNVAELASIYHLPNKSVSTPHIVWVGAKKGEPPANLPLADETPAEVLTNLGITNFRGSQEKFGVKISDRRRHIYVVGKSGTGKSTLLQNMAVDDITEGRGVAVVDPHGEYVDYVLDRIPDERIDDVVVFDPNDKEFPVGFNILEVEDVRYKLVTASGVVGVFKKIFGESWGPRLEYWLSSAILALLDFPGATLVMVPRLFVDDAFREEVIAQVQDPIIKNRWLTEYNKLDQRQRNETISPILNKVGQFLSSGIIRNIVGQTKSTINMRKLMDDGKLLLVKLSKGLIGEDNAALLGALIITKLQLAAMSRADSITASRKDFFLYVDEFQNFATDSFATILSEARKYGLSLTLAHQYIAQLSEVVSKAVFGNVGTLISFRVGSDDAAFLTKEFAPVFTEQDLVNLDVFNIYVKLSIDGLTAGAFSAVTLPPSAEKNNNRGRVLEQSRKKYSARAAGVEENIRTVQAGTGAASPARRPSGQPVPPGASVAPVSKAPNISGLKSLISTIERKRQERLGPKQKEDLAKTLVEDLKSEPTSFKEALEKAKEQKEEEQQGGATELKPDQPIKIEPPEEGQNPL